MIEFILTVFDFLMNLLTFDLWVWGEWQGKKVPNIKVKKLDI